MSDKNDRNTSEEIDFTNSSSFQKIVNKTKRKQTVKYTLIAFITTIVLLILLLQGSHYILQNRIMNDTSTITSAIRGANLSQSQSRESDEYNLFSATLENSSWKEIGGRVILWDTKSIKIPLFGKKTTVDRGSGDIEIRTFSDKEKRYVPINHFNGERKIEFYHPQLTYDYLPHELEIASELDDNKLIEVALSFDKPLTLEEVSNQLGKKNVNWVWVNTTSQTQVEEYKETQKSYRDHHVLTMSGASAYGFRIEPNIDIEIASNGFLSYLNQLSQDGNKKIEKIQSIIKEESFPENSDIRIAGAVITGSPKELERFQELDFIRASLIGATIDNY